MQNSLATRDDRMSANQMPWDGEYRELGLHGLPVDRPSVGAGAGELGFDFKSLQWWQAVAYETELVMRFLGVKIDVALPAQKQANRFDAEVVAPLRYPEPLTHHPRQTPPSRNDMLPVDSLPVWFPSLERSYLAHKTFLPPAWKALYLGLVSGNGFSVKKEVREAIGDSVFKRLPTLTQETLLSRSTVALFNRHALRKADRWVRKHVSSSASGRNMFGFLIKELRGGTKGNGIAVRQFEKLIRNHEVIPSLPYMGEAIADSDTLLPEDESAKRKEQRKRQEIIDQFSDLEIRAFAFTMTSGGRRKNRTSDDWDNEFSDQLIGNETIEDAKAASVSAWKKALQLKRKNMI